MVPVPMNSGRPTNEARYAVILPACNEEACIPAVLREVKAVLPADRFIVVVGVNGSSDTTAELARAEGVLVGETTARGYGHGCMAGIRAVEASLGPGEGVAGFLFLAADGANDPRDIPALVEKHREGYALVLGCRTTLSENRTVMSLQHTVANRVLGLWTSLLALGSGGPWFADLGPLRLIDSRLFPNLRLQELTYGWTIEAQLKAVLLGARVCEVPVRERPRLAGEQKISAVSLRKTLSVGSQIFAAGWRARWGKR